MDVVKESFEKTAKSLEDQKQEGKEGMETLKIYRFQAKQIEDTFRMFNNFYQCHKKESSADRDFMQSWQMIKNVLSGEIDKHVERF